MLPSAASVLSRKEFQQRFSKKERLGCLKVGADMVLVQKPRTAELLKTLDEPGIRAEVFRPIAGACSLTMG